MCSKKRERSQNHIIVYFTILYYVIPDAENDLERKEKTEPSIVSFPFTLSLLISKLKVENVGKMYQEVT